MPLPEGTYTIGNLMQDAGYVTGGIGKWSLGAAGSVGEPGNLGFDYFYGYLNQSQAHDYYPQHLWENGRWDTLQNDFFIPRAELDKTASLKDFEKYAGKEYAPDKMTEKALSFIDNNKDKPFFLYLPYPIPHAPITIPWDSEAYGIYKSNRIDLENNNIAEGRWDTVAYYGDQGYTPHPQPRAAYAAMITQLDMYVGKIMEKIKQLGLDENTIIMFSSDNGTTFNGGVEADFFNSTAGLRGLKLDLYEGGIRMPFIARWPGSIPAGKVTDHVSAQYDMMATLADLVQGNAPENDGISILPVLLGKDSDQVKHDFLYFEYPGNGGQVAVRMGDWKGIKVDMKNNPDAEWQLYNLTTDVAEKNNVAGQHADIITKLDSIVQQEHRPAHIRDWEFIDRRFSGSKSSQIKEFEKNHQL
jgi:arylsulfatase A